MHQHGAGWLVETGGRGYKYATSHWLLLYCVSRQTKSVNSHGDTQVAANVPHIKNIPLNTIRQALNA